MSVSGGGLRAFDHLRLCDSDIWFHGSLDSNHGLGWYGTGKLFASNNVNGPVLFGNGGGALDTGGIVAPRAP